LFYYDKKKWGIQRYKESDRIIIRLNEIEKKRKDWNDKHIPDIYLPMVPIQDLKFNKAASRKFSMVKVDT
jgi:hypothetical protein